MSLKPVHTHMRVLHSIFRIVLHVFGHSCPAFVLRDQAPRECGIRWCAAPQGGRPFCALAFCTAGETYDSNPLNTECIFHGSSMWQCYLPEKPQRHTTTLNTKTIVLQQRPSHKFRPSCNSIPGHYAAHTTNFKQRSRAVRLSAPSSQVSKIAFSYTPLPHP